MAERAGADLDAFFALSSDLLAVAGFDGYFVAVNPAWRETLGWDLDDLTASPFVSFVHPDDAEATLEELARVRRGSPVTGFENRYRSRDGSYRWLQWNASARGDLVYALARDVTRAKDVEASLRRSERFLASIVDNIPDMVFVKRADDLTFVRVNRAGEQLLGLSEQELFGRGDADFFPDDEAAFFVAKDREVLASGRLVDIPAETIATRAHGERVLHTKKIPIADESGRPRFLLGISEDVTEAVARDELSRRRRQLLDAVLDASPDAVVVVDADHVVQEASTAVEGLCDVRAPELRGRSIVELAVAEDAASLRQALCSLGQPRATVTARFRVRGPGRPVPVEARGRALVDRDGGVTGAVVVVRDITESLAMETAREQLGRSEAEHRLVADLQRRVLVAPPPVPGLETAAYYQPASRDVQMGGDWFHGMALGGDRLGLIVGDVAGHGIGAAGEMTQLSGVVATLLKVAVPLDDLLGVLDAAILPSRTMASVVVAVIDARARRIHYVSAGHPPLAVVDAAGVASFLEDGRRPPVGVTSPSVRHGEADLPVGSTLVAYTDGLIERRGELIDVGFERLQRALGATAGLDVDAQLAQVVGRCTVDHGVEDDIAVVLVRSVVTS